jgi:hypothetical protein
MHILDAAAQITENVIVVVKVVAKAGSDGCRRTATVSVRSLVKDFQAHLSSGITWRVTTAPIRQKS